MTKTKSMYLAILAVLLSPMGANAVPIVIVVLDADTVATGSGIDTVPLDVGIGTISFIGEIRDRDSDPEFNAVGALGDVFDIRDSDSTATLLFSFDVSSLTFIFGGNSGNISIEARDFVGGVVDSFFQASTGDGAFAGPLTLSGAGIRSLFWRDTGGVFAPLDNIAVSVDAVNVPEPGTLALLGIGLFGMGLARRRRKF